MYLLVFDTLQELQINAQLHVCFRKHTLVLLLLLAFIFDCCIATLRGTLKLSRWCCHGYAQKTDFIFCIQLFIYIHIPTYTYNIYVYIYVHVPCTKYRVYTYIFLFNIQLFNSIQYCVRSPPFWKIIPFMKTDYLRYYGASIRFFICEL